METIIVTEPMSREELKSIAKEGFGDLVKAVVDVERHIMVLGGEMHADEEAELLAQDSTQGNLWGINLYPEVMSEDWIEFDSMINVRPSQGNRSRGVENPVVRAKIIEIVNGLIK